MDTGLVTIRFRTCRSSLTSCHYAGIEYEVPASFARQVVEQERVAEYVVPDAEPESVESRTPPRRRANRGV
jgi:hypothetical protein